MKAVVTGGAGFIGSHLVERLISGGHEVVVLDDLSNGRSGNLAGVDGDPKFTFRQADIADYDSVKGFFTGVDWVFHLAALADIVPSIVEPLKYHRANVDGTASILEAARQAGVSKFVYAASASCYGIPDKFPTPETAEMRPMYPYAHTKLIGEQYLLHWNQVYRLPSVSLRLSNVYGPRTRTSGTYGAVFGVFLAQKLAGEPYTVVGDGTQSRDFVFVTDVAEAFLRAAESDLSVHVLNVGSSHTYSVNHLVKLLGGATVHIPKRPGEPDCTFSDTAKIKRLLSWEPKVCFEDGVQIMLENIEYWSDAPVWNPAKIASATGDWFKHLG